MDKEHSKNIVLMAIMIFGIIIIICTTVISIFFATFKCECYH